MSNKNFLRTKIDKTVLFSLVNFACLFAQLPLRGFHNLHCTSDTLGEGKSTSRIDFLSKTFNQHLKIPLAIDFATANMTFNCYYALRCILMGAHHPKKLRSSPNFSIPIGVKKHEHKFKQLDFWNYVHTGEHSSAHSWANYHACILRNCTLFLK